VPIGPVIGPLVICGVCFHKKKLSILDQLGVKDSKKLSPNKRKELSTFLLDTCHSYKLNVITPQEIDDRQKSRMTLNKLEIINISEMLNELRPNHVYIDAADVNEKRFGNTIHSLLAYSPARIVSKHKADDTFPVVSAASILAKNKRDEIVSQLNEIYGHFGSGYPSDERTITFLRNWISINKKAPPIARKSWETTKRLLDELVYNKKITHYFK
jgi:ribonuclease HII